MRRRVQDRAPSAAPSGERRMSDPGRAAERARMLAQANAQLEESRQKGVRPGKPAYGDTPLLSVGKEVRVELGGMCRRALIETVNEAEKTVDVLLYSLGGDDEEEEQTLPNASVRPLEKFELRTEEERLKAFEADLYAAAQEAKEDGNALFKLKDYAAAVQLYGLAVDALRKFRQPEPGKECWVVMNHNSSLVLGAVREVEAAAHKADVALYEPGKEGLQVFKGAPWRVLVPVHEGQLPLHSSLYTNRAKSLVQLGFHQEAAQDLTMTIGLWAARDEGKRRGSGVIARPLAPEEVGEQREQLIKAFYLRAKTRLARSKFANAKSDVADALVLGPSASMMGLLRTLEREVEAAQREEARGNKRLAKEIAKWADKAMSQLDPAALAALEQRAAREAAVVPDGCTSRFAEDSELPPIVSL